MPLDRAGRWRKVSREGVWALEEHDGQLWMLQGVSDDPASAVRFALSSRLTRH
ncbi:MAG: hypothetical protein JWO22_416 [Frankiales bacterium]|nr:hypothetical protein [Frankiales bacterium]